MRVFVLPDLEVLDRGGSTATDPALVEHLVDLLFRHGYANVVIGASPPRDARWLEHRDVMVLTDLAGYRYTTDAGNAYDIVDCSEDLVAADFPPESVLEGSDLARPWLDADVRIVFAKNKTDDEQGFSLALQTMLNVLPLHDKLYHYRARLSPSDLAVDLLRRTPVHVAIDRRSHQQSRRGRERSVEPDRDRNGDRRHRRAAHGPRRCAEDGPRPVRLRGERSRRCA